MSIRDWLRIIWHTRPGHSPGLIRTRGYIVCGGCGAVLAR